MPVKKIEFGKPFPSFSDEQYRDGIAQVLKDGFVDVDGSFVKRPGLTTFSTISGSQPVMSLYESVADKCLAISNGKLWSIASGTATGAATEITGTGLSAGVRCTFAEDRNNVYIANPAGRLLQVASAFGSFSAMTASGHPISSSHVLYQQGHLLCNPLATTTAGTAGVVAGDVAFNNLASYPGSGWRVFNNESNPDGVLTLYQIWDEIYAIGPRTTEASWDDGSTPWAKSNAPTLEYGTPAPYSFIKAKDQVFWYSMFEGAFHFITIEQRRGVVISSPYDAVLQNLTDHANVYGYKVTIDGNLYCLWNFPADGFTICYNTSTKTWSQWGTWGGAAYTSYLGNCSLFMRTYNKMLIGSSANTGKVYLPTGTNDDGTAIRFELTSGNESFGTDRKKIFDSALIKWRANNASNTFKLSWRDQGASSWHSDVVVGPQGYAYDTYFARLNLLGSARERQWKIVHDDANYEFAFVSMEVNYRVTGI